MIYSEKTVFENVTDFNPVHIFECGQVFRWIPDTEHESGYGSDGTVVYKGFAGNYAARVIYRDASPSGEYGYDTKKGNLTIESTGGSRNFWHEYFDLGTDYTNIKRTLIKTEPKIKPATEYGYGIRILNQNLFETIISFIISQNNNIPRIRKCIEAICKQYGESVAGTEGRCLHAFPTPEVLASANVEDIAALKLGYRSSYIQRAAEEFIEWGRPSGREDLIRMHGIGPKVANCIMLFGLHDVSAFPIDTWVKQIMSDMYGFAGDDVKGMQCFADEKFGRFAGYAQQYLFYYYRERMARGK